MVVRSHRVEIAYNLLITIIQGRPTNDSVEKCWKIGEGFMHLKNMFLVRLVSVSKGSFQPEIWVMI